MATAPASRRRLPRQLVREAYITIRLEDDELKLLFEEKKRLADANKLLSDVIPLFGLYSERRGFTPDKEKKDKVISGLEGVISHLKRAKKDMKRMAKLGTSLHHLCRNIENEARKEDPNARLDPQFVLAISYFSDLFSRESPQGDKLRRSIGAYDELHAARIPRLIDFTASIMQRLEQAADAWAYPQNSPQERLILMKHMQLAEDLGQLRNDLYRYARMTDSLIAFARKHLEISELALKRLE